jgi:site-specific recombinase XerC
LERSAGIAFQPLQHCPEARAWLSFQAYRGLALNALDAYGRNLERYLRFVEETGKKPWELRRDTAGAYLHGFVSVAGEHVDGINTTPMANATIQQHLATLRMLHEYLIEEEYCTRNPFRNAAGAWSRPLIKREHKPPWIPNEEEWHCFLAAASDEPIRNKLMLAMSYDAALRREELCLLETADIDPSRRTLQIRAETTKNRPITRAALFSRNRRVVRDLSRRAPKAKPSARKDVPVRVAPESICTAIDLDLVEGSARNRPESWAHWLFAAYASTSLPHRLGSG